ncbi:uncharacterized protein K452DRAFT_34129 [Aplosporella prunicola CBS 121167]|uniref:Uncharacterized protein n=1 Tax=Aplosporella prunicola CBS 121167 TaxID=1176127 RepID=A0A6A6BC80_9PEZI|nr:uncharacterized protein K452DRAFT_34129 [Aplosporella prunicola CBS 121167]KAF2141819.1 hypothetical protein K452DRAFT_34129 [Aplosporella prunicola CBS 121167]
MGFFTPSSRSPYNNAHRPSSWHPSSSSRPSSWHYPSHSRPSSGHSTPRSYHSSYYKRSPRPSYIQQLLRKLKQLLRELYEYARRHPLKLAMSVIVPLLSTGVFAEAAHRFGLSLPAVVMSALGGPPAGASRVRGGGGYYGSRGYGSDGGEGLDLKSFLSLVRMFA